MTGQEWFGETLEQSKVKSDIVCKYFEAWAKIVSPHSGTGRIAYIDLYSGPGVYEDGSKSTPIRIIETCLSDQQLRTRLVTVFNDQNALYCRRLEEAIQHVEGIAALKYQPQVCTGQVDGGFDAAFREMRLVPTLLFLDPWGYKGLSLELVNSVVKDWACECVFFFNYNRVNPGLENKSVDRHIDGIFGAARAKQLRAEVADLKPAGRERVVMGRLVEALTENGRFALPFCFKDRAHKRTSHYLVHVCKNFLGYDIMKSIMAEASTHDVQGVPSFEYNPARVRQPVLLETACPLDELEAALVVRFAGTELTMKEVYQQHTVGTPYIKRNYKEVLAKLEAKGIVRASPSASERRKGTLADTVLITFPG